MKGSPLHILARDHHILRRWPFTHQTSDGTGIKLVVICNDVVAHLNAFITDENAWTGNQLPHIVQILVAERAAQELSQIACGFALYARYKDLARRRPRACGPLREAASFS